MSINYKNELFYVKHLSPEDDLSGFTVAKGFGLENYLKFYAKGDENDGIARTYLVKDYDGLIVAYFSLRTGLLTVSRGLFKGFDAYTGIELANFAVNDNARINNGVIPRLGSYIFAEFIIPIVQDIHTMVGSKFLYIYALPNNKLMDHYKTMGFNQVSSKLEKYIYRHVKPAYDKGCRLMLQSI